MTVASIARPVDPTRQTPLRLWPGVVLVALQWLARFGVPVVAPEAVMFALIGGLLGGVAIVLWWAFFSRARWGDRILGVASMIVALVATRPLLHESMATAGMGMIYFLYAIPVLSLAFVVWAAASRRLGDGPRRATMVATVLVACGAWTLFRTYGVTGGGDWDFDWRWARTPEERLLARADDTPTPLPPAAAAVDADAPWPGFRGPGRDGVVRALRIGTDWSASPPVELWRRPVGPGWSSFAVRGDRLYTQEQRGDDEVVSCYRVATGEPLWIHANAVRFWEAMAGAGPRATPTVSGGRVYALGATGILDALDAADGGVAWSRDVVADTGAVTPGWGFAGSPQVVGDLVLVAASGLLAAYDLETGALRWKGATHAESYSSPHLLTLDGIEQIVLLTGSSVVGVTPADGSTLWEHAWEGFHSLQPALTADGDLLIASSGAAGGYGTRRLSIRHGAGGWDVEERWTSIGLKPYFNDLVVHRGHAYGFDGSILAAIGLDDGKRRWKGGRYGNGQLVLLADQDLLLVLSERGELALVAAAPDRFLELARVPAIAGKTWNHPAVAGDLLLVRNGQEMAAFRLPLAAEATGP
jgi:outer membrane protein assembly factor BamB